VEEISKIIAHSFGNVVIDGTPNITEDQFTASVASELNY
jgi:hypothetical protein